MTMRLTAVALLALLLPSVSPARAAENPVGRYRIAEGPDIASELEIGSDGRFTYFLSSGALDEHAKGRWQAIDSGIFLFTEPKPVPPVFTAHPPTRTPGGNVSVSVAWPNGRGIAGIEFRMGFATGEPLSGHTQEDGWTLPANEHRVPLWIVLAEPIHGIISPRFPIDATKGNVLRFSLIPNDMEVYDFEAAEVEILPGALRLHRGATILRYVREKR